MTIATLPNFGQRVTARNRPPADHEITVDSFAGWGGWGLGEEHSTGWAIDVAINHDARAIAAHRINHPATLHYQSDVFEIDPRTVEPGRSIAHCHFSPDCTHHSKARGSAPVSDRVRGLAWIVLAWAHFRGPRVLTLENVEEFKDWGPTAGGRALRGPGARGRTFRAFVDMLTTGVAANHPDLPGAMRLLAPLGVPAAALIAGLGYAAEWRELRACDYGAPTIRKRFVLVARRDGRPIKWPEVTHGPDAPEPHRTAAECIDWSLPCPSIFMTRDEARAWGKQRGCRPPKRPLAEKTLRRIAAGVRRYVIDAAPGSGPFLAVLNHGDNGAARVHPLDAPLRTVQASCRGGEALVLPVLAHFNGEAPHQDTRGQRVDRPLTTLSGCNRHALVAAFLSKHRRGAVGCDLRQPMPTITAGSGAARPAGAAHATALTAAHLMKLRGTSRHGAELGRPAPTVCASGGHAALVASFLAPYYGSGSGLAGRAIDAPAPTLTAKDRLQLVTVNIAGKPWVIAALACGCSSRTSCCAPSSAIWPAAG